MRMGKYELGRTIGHGSFGKVKFAINVENGQPFALKVLDKSKIIDLKFTHQFKREIRTLKLLKHPNIIRLYEVLASKSKIYMVLEYVNGGELYYKIASKGMLSEAEGKKVFQQLIDGVSYCHSKGVYHRDLKLENILVDIRGNIKISDFGLCALQEHLRDDCLLHTTCGSPNYVAPEILANRGYDGAASDIWSCGVILFVILTGLLPFDDTNLCVLYQKIKNGEITELPKWLSQGAQNLIRRILDPNPKTRITMASIKRDDWFRKDYHPTYFDDEEEDIFTSEVDNSIDQEDISEKKIRFTTNQYSTKEDIFKQMEFLVTEMGFLIHRKDGRLKVMREMERGENGSVTTILSISAKVFEISPSLYVVELKKLHGDSSSFRQLCKSLSSDLGIPPGITRDDITSSVL
ncbi:CBL-interacting serine/threonine-protein kinase 1-like isoform X11 [Cucumis melo]|uniref:CBL-interacting serine/threonine-protein kinase 1-like isoform X11 n=1 Tax=Cucumis melo TaxID=3656 RepID=A0ABM3LCZ0_CUCME|nr:CBL-interacting serine/threonine-protein kinase 1-like isoform X11 [Cucumis melo]